MYDQLYNTFCLATCHKISLDFLRLKNPFLVAPLFWKWPRIGKGALTTESQPWPWLLIYQRLLTPLTTIFCWQSWKPMVSLNPPWVWCHPICSSSLCHPILFDVILCHPILSFVFIYIFFCFILLFTSSSPCRKDQFAVSYFSQTEGLFARCLLKLFRVEGGASTGVPPRATVV